MAGQSVTEYALIVGLTVLVTVATLALLGTHLSDVLAWIAGEIN